MKPVSVKRIVSKGSTLIIKVKGVPIVAKNAKLVTFPVITVPPVIPQKR